MQETEQPGRWSEAWMDALAFLLGLAMAWQFSWKTGDLVWSLWLSSLVVGYATIAWIVIRTGRGQAAGMSGAKALPGVLFMLVFFTIHFGGFHFVHSAFLQNFFPVGGDAAGEAQEFPSWSTYAEVFRRYWWFVPLAFIAERRSFTSSLQPRSRPADDAPRKHRRMPPVGPRGVAGQPVRAPNMVGQAMSAPYRNVVRMHLLIFFFAAVHFLGAENFLVYAVVYAVYFFPWRTLRRARQQVEA